LCLAGASCHEWHNEDVSKKALCACGCGQETNLAKNTVKARGVVKGQPNKWIRGHRNRIYAHGSTCAVTNCPHPIEARAVCHRHLEQRRRTGALPDSFEPSPTTREEKFLAKVKVLPSGHWIWNKATASEGRYGAVQHDGRVQPAHRVAWLIFRGAIPEGLVIDHLCRKTLCVNPDHLEPKTQRHNILVGDAPPALNAAKTHCKRGHEFTPENTLVMSSGGRSCIACNKSEEGRVPARERTRKYRERKRAALAAA
jgi:hypothetical protein